jgi:hypothetical protein
MVKDGEDGEILSKGLKDWQTSQGLAESRLKYKARMKKIKRVIIII